MSFRLNFRDSWRNCNRLSIHEKGYWNAINHERNLHEHSSLRAVPSSSIWIILNPSSTHYFSERLDDCLSLFSDWFENWYLPATIRTFTESERKLKSIISLRLASPRGNCFSFHLIIAFLRLHSAEDDMFGPSICLFGCDIETDLLLSIRDGWLRFIMGSVASVSCGRKRTFQCCPTSIT